MQFHTRILAVILLSTASMSTIAAMQPASHAAKAIPLPVLNDREPNACALHQDRCQPDSEAVLTAAAKKPAKK